MEFPSPSFTGVYRKFHFPSSWTESICSISLVSRLFANNQFVLYERQSILRSWCVWTSRSSRRHSLHLFAIFWTNTSQFREKGWRNHSIVFTKRKTTAKNVLYRNKNKKLREMGAVRRATDDRRFLGDKCWMSVCFSHHAQPAVSCIRFKISCGKSFQFPILIIILKAIKGKCQKSTQTGNTIYLSITFFVHLSQRMSQWKCNFHSFRN